jgi:hypothetical protein
MMNNLAETLRAQGDLAGARKIQEQVLEITRSVLGEKHPHTSISAWNLYNILVELHDLEATEVLDNNLLWLMDRDPTTLGADQQQIREWISQIVG